MKIEIKHRRTGAVLFSYECENNTEKITLEAGVQSGANLNGAYLGGADLSGASLYGAYLYEANLGGADLNGADLTGAYLGGTDLGGADLGGAKIYGVEILNAEQAAPLLAQVAAAALATPEALSMGARRLLLTLPLQL